MNEASVPGDGVPKCFVFFLVFLVLLFVVTDYLWRLYACRHDTIRAANERVGRRYGIWRWFVFPLVITIGVSVLVSDWPMRLRFAVSRTAFEHVHEQFETSGKIPSGELWIGLYRVRVSQIHGYLFFETCSVFFDQYGFGKGDPKLPDLSIRDDVGNGWCVVRYRM